MKPIVILKQYHYELISTRVVHLGAPNSLPTDSWIVLECQHTAFYAGEVKVTESMLTCKRCIRRDKLYREFYKTPKKKK